MTQPYDLPQGYTIEEGEAIGYGRNYGHRYFPVRNGVRFLDEGRGKAPDAPPGGSSDIETVIETCWSDYYGQIAIQRNAERPNEENHVLAWCLPNGDVYSADHLTLRHIPLQDLEEVTIGTHSAGYEIANMLCAHCGTSAVDDDILSEDHLLNEGWGDEDEEDEDEEDAGEKEEEG